MQFSAECVRVAVSALHRHKLPFCVVRNRQTWIDNEGNEIEIGCIFLYEFAYESLKISIVLSSIQTRRSKCAASNVLSVFMYAFDTSVYNRNAIIVFFFAFFFATHNVNSIQWVYILEQHARCLFEILWMVMYSNAIVYINCSSAHRPLSRYIL